MEQGYFVGAFPFNFRDDSGREICGVKIFLCAPDKDHIGMAPVYTPFKRFPVVSQDSEVFAIARNLLFGDKVEFLIDRKGKLSQLKACI